MAIFASSDLHFGNRQDFLWGPRGFRSIEEHDEAIIANWNSIVSPEDDVYLLGDLMHNDTEHGLSCVRRLNGRLHLVRGNHDSDVRWAMYADLPNVVELCGWAHVIRYRKIHFYLSHFPTLTANYDDEPLYKKIISLCGHSHTKDPFVDMDRSLIYHVELDANDNSPVLLDDIIEKIRNRMNPTQ